MSRMIDADALLELYDDCEGLHVPVEVIIQNVKDMPTVAEHVKHEHRTYDGNFDMTNCPNCGAPINGDVCEYCGTGLSRLQNKLCYYDEPNANGVVLPSDTAEEYAQTLVTIASNGWRPANVYIFHDDLKESYEHLSGNGEINRIGDLFIQV